MSYIVPMYIETVPNRKSRPAVLLREGWREGNKVKKRTLANLTDWPREKIEALRAVLRGATHLAGKLEDSFEIVRTKPHGHVAAVLGTLRRLGLDHLIAAKRCRERDLIVAMVVARVIEPASKLATARGLGEETSFSTLGESLEVESADEDELYKAMDWLLRRQERIEQALAKRHLFEGTLVFYDVTSAYFEGRSCPLAKLGHNREGKKDKLQIVFGLLCNAKGCPVAVEVFEGNTGDPKTLASQIQKVRERFRLRRVVFVGDRGMITSARIREDLKPEEGIDFVTALRAPAIRALVDKGAIQLGLFDQRDLAEVSDAAYPGERLVVCKNPFLTKERGRKREELLQATEKELSAIVEATRRAKRRLKGKEKIALRVGKVLGRFKMRKHFRIEITDESFSYEREAQKIAEEAALDGIYVIRTSVPQAELSAESAVLVYKGLSAVERAFRCLKTVDLKVRPIYHRMPDRVKSHVLICMLAYYVEWHMRQALAPILFDDDDKAGAESRRESVVKPAERSPRAREKARTKHTEEGLVVHSFQTLLKDLKTVAKNRVLPTGIPGATTFDKITTPTPLQQRAFDLLKVNCRMLP
jgi:transposase